MRRTASEAADGAPEDGSPPAKRMKMTVPITSPNLDEVRAAFHTDCEILAVSGDEVLRVFPVNRMVVCGWSEPFAVMVNGSFVEGQSRQIRLPYSEAVVTIAVQHMYSSLSDTLAGTPAIPPAEVMNVLELAHMYDQKDLFAQAENAYWNSDDVVPDRPEVLAHVRQSLQLGIDPVRLVERFLKAFIYRFDDFSLDVHDEVLKPFITALFHHSPRIGFVYFLTTEYTAEVKLAAQYAVFDTVGDEWEEYLQWKNDLGEMSKELVGRITSFEKDVWYATTHNDCGYLQRDHALQTLLYALEDEEDPVIEAEIQACIDLCHNNDDDDDDFYVPYSDLMRKLNPPGGRT